MPSDAQDSLLTSDCAGQMLNLHALQNCVIHVYAMLRSALSS